MAKILKFKKGKSTREMLAQLAQNQDSLSTASVTTEQRELLDRITRNAEQYLQENPLNEKNEAAYRLQVSNAMLDILDGGTGYNQYQIDAPRTNMWGNHSQGSTNQIVNQIIQDSANGQVYTRTGGKRVIKPLSSSGNAPTATNTSSSPISELYFYSPLSNLEDNGWGTFATSSVKDRIFTFGNSVLSNLEDALNAKKAGKTIHGFTGNWNNVNDTNINNLKSYLATLQDREDVGIDDIYKFSTYIRQLAPETATMFNNYFIDILENEPVKDKRLRELKNKGFIEYAYDSPYLTKNKYHLMQDKNGKLSLYTDDYKIITDPVQYIDTNTDTGFFFNADKGIYSGNVGEVTADNPLFDDITTYRENLVLPEEYLADQWGDNSVPDSTPLYQKLVDSGILKKGTYFTDLSNLFKGDEQIIAINNDGSAISNNYYGDPILTNSTLYRLKNGKLEKTNLNKLKALYNREGFGEDNSKYNIIGYDKAFEEIGDQYLNTGIISDNADILGRSIWTRSRFRNNIDINPNLFVNNMVKAVKAEKNGNSRNIELDSGSWTIPNISASEFLENISYYSNPLDVLAYTINLIKKDNSINVSREDLNLLYRAFNEYAKKYHNTSEVEVKKEGGIIKMQEGKRISAVSREEVEETKTGVTDKTEKNKEKAKEAGYGTDVNRHKANEDDEWKTEDTLRLAALAQDVAATAASFGVGAGSLAAGGLGLTSMLTDLTADIMDESVSGWEVAKNALFNTGLAAAGMIPGLGASKVVKQLVKWLPRLISYGSSIGLAMDDEVQDTFSKVFSSNPDLNRKDWKNLTTFLSSLLGSARQGRTDYARIEVAKAGNPSTAYTIDGVNKEFTKAEADALNKALKEKSPKYKTLSEKYGVDEKKLKAIAQEYREKNKVKKAVTNPISFDKKQNVDAANLQKLWTDTNAAYLNRKPFRSSWIDSLDSNHWLRRMGISNDPIMHQVIRERYPDITFEKRGGRIEKLRKLKS